MMIGILLPARNNEIKNKIKDTIKKQKTNKIFFDFSIKLEWQIFLKLRTSIKNLLLLTLFKKIQYNKSLYV